MNTNNQTIDVSSTVTRADTSWPVLCHLLSLVVLFGIPFGNILGPLALWLLKKDRDTEVDRYGRESLNFQLSMTIYTMIAGISMIVFIGFALVPALFVMNMVCVAIASIKASRGEFYRYPLAIPFV